MKQALLVALLMGSSPITRATPVKLLSRDTSASLLNWTSCGNDMPSSLDCAQIQVPLDWSNQTGPQITLGMSRLKATNNATRLGNLIVNPGGPGAAGTLLCLYQAMGAPFLTDALTSHYDIICPDPRGIGTSTPIICDPEIWNMRQTLFPADNASYDAMTHHFKALGESCLDLSGDLIKYVDTASVARDFEVIRSALGEGKLNYFGVSYGTQIGTTYASLYPENINRMALDGILDHAARETYFTFTESETYEADLGRFFVWCNKNESCALQGQNVSQIFEDVVAQAHSRPIIAPDCLTTSNNTLYAGTCFANVTGEEIRFNAQGFLGSKPNGWPVLGLALSQAASGNATLLSTRLASNSSPNYQGLVIACLDWQRSSSFADSKNKQMLLNSTASYTRGASHSWTFEASCAGWPVPVTNPPQDLNATAMALTPPILLVNALYDPATSYVWANSVKDHVPNGVLLTRNGDGHTSYLLRGEATAAMDAYLVNGTLPAANTVVQT